MPTSGLALVADTDIARFAPQPGVRQPSPIFVPLWQRLAARRGQALRIALGLSLAAAGAALYAPDVLYTSSSEAVLNARTVTITAPIDGRVTAAPSSEGMAIAAGAPLLTIENPVVDRSRLGELEAARTRTEAELTAAKGLIDTLRRQTAGLEQQSAAYRQGVVARLDLAAQEAHATLTAAEASAAEARNTLARKQTLAASGWASAADFDHAAQMSARADAEAGRARLTAARQKQELEAVQHGVFVAEDNNGAPYAQQRTDEFRLRIAEAQAQADALAARLAQTEEQAAAERRRVDRLAAAELRAPVAGVVWRPDVTVGSSVGRDREMMTLIDCSSLYVTASFSSRQFDNLHPGAQATVRVADSGKRYAATVVDVRAVNGEANDHFAAPLPRLGTRQVMAVLRLDDPGAMESAKYCGVGRRVDVRFNDLAPATAETKIASDAR